MSVPAVPYAVAGHVRGRPRRKAAEFPVQKSGRSSRLPGTYGTAGTENNSILYERINGNDELTETENVIFLRKPRSSYGILTEFLRMNVILAYFCNGARIRLRINGNVTVEATHDFRSTSRSTPFPHRMDAPLPPSDRAILRGISTFCLAYSAQLVSKNW